MDSKYEHIKKQAFEANIQLPEYGLVKYTFGNVSAFDRELGAFAIKPSGVPYNKLSADAMVVVGLDGKVLEGKLRPSSDTKTHQVLYSRFHDITGIVHVHSTYATAWAQAIQPIPILGTTHADHLATDVPCTKILSDEMINGDYEEQTGYQILEEFRNLSYKEVEMVLIACHGPFTWGNTPEKAVYNAVILEELAKMAFLTKGINQKTGKLKSTLISKHYERKHGAKAYYGQ